MAKLYVKSPNGTQKDIDLDKIFTTDGGTINGKIKFDIIDEEEPKELV